jgi:two-component SAPR family response regulator
MEVDLKVLVVDDSRLALLDIQSKLSTVVPKESILLAKSYFEAVDLLEKYEFNIAFVDLQMPEKTGMDLIHVNPKTKDLPVVVTTSVKPDSLITFSLKGLTYRYLFKPISREQILEAISNIVPPKSTDSYESV